MRARHIEIESRNEALLARLGQEAGLFYELNAMLELSYIFHDNALEGTVLTQEELRLAFDPMHVADRERAPAHLALNYQKAALAFAREEARREEAVYDLALFTKLSSLLALGCVDPEEQPRYRKDLPAHRTYFHEIVPATQVEAHIAAFGALLETSEFQELPPVDQAAWLHWRFMRVYPFAEQNGRIARLLMQTHLLRHGLPLLIIHASDRQRYFEALARPLSVFQALMREGMENSLSNALRFCGPAVPQPKSQPKSQPRSTSKPQAKAKSQAKSKPVKAVKKNSAKKEPTKVANPKSAKARKAAVRKAS